MKLCKEIYPNYQCVVSTDIDKGHLHNHIVCAPIRGRVNPLSKRQA